MSDPGDPKMVLNSTILSGIFLRLMRKKNWIAPFFSFFYKKCVGDGMPHFPSR